MPLPSTMTPIATQTLSATSSLVTFSNIPQQYTDLVLVMNYRNTKDIDNYGYPNLRFNSDTGTNYSHTSLYGSGSTVTSSRQSNISYVNCYEGAGNAPNANVYGLIRLNIMNYSSTSVFKNVLIRGGTPQSSTIVAMQAAIWRSTSAITTITVADGSTSIGIGSDFTLYGIKAAT